MKIILSSIAACLIKITLKLYIPRLEAEEQRSQRSIERIIESCDVTGYVDDDYLYSSDIDC